MEDMVLKALLFCDDRKDLENKLIGLKDTQCEYYICGAWGDFPLASLGSSVIEAQASRKDEFHSHLYRHLALHGDMDHYFLILGPQRFLTTANWQQLFEEFARDYMMVFASPGTSAQTASPVYAPAADPNCCVVRARNINDMEFHDRDDLLIGLIDFANRCGYRSVLTTALSSGSSFEPSQLQISGYPVIRESISRFLESPKNELLLAPPPSQSLLIDISHLAAFHNGSFNYLKSIIRGWQKNLEHFQVTLVANKTALEYHQLLDLGANYNYISALSELSGNTQYQTGIRLGQPWSWQETLLLMKACQNTYWIILDTIGWDCFYIRNGFPSLDELWNFTADHADGFGYISDYSKTQFLSRFPQAHDKKNVTHLLSCASKDYFDTKEFTVDADQNYVLVIGNNFHHKSSNEICKSLLKLGHKIKVLGDVRFEDPNMICYKSGEHSAQFLSSLYKNAKCIVYPSHYEGFGFPIMESIAHDRAVLARNSPQLQEIIKNTDKPSLIHGFDCFSELGGLLASLESSQKNAPLLRPPWSWADSAEALWKLVDDSTSKTKTTAERQKLLRTVDCLSKALKQKL